jgi:hypothetical protein
MNDEDEQPQAGPSRRQSPSGRVQSGETMTIPSTGTSTSIIGFRYHSPDRLGPYANLSLPLTTSLPWPASPTLSSNLPPAPSLPR